MSTPAPQFEPQHTGALPGEDIFADMREDEIAERTGIFREHTLAATLAGARALVPVLTALVKHPGVEADKGELQAATAAMIDSARAIAEHAMAALGVRDEAGNDWAKSMLMQTAVEAVAAEWREHGHCNAADWPTLIESVLKSGVGETRRPYPVVDDATAYQVSHFSALARVGGEVRRFSFFFDAHALLERVSGFLESTVASAADAVVADTGATGKDRLMVEQGLLNHAGRLFAEIYREYAESCMIEVCRMDETQRKRYLEDGNPAQRLGEVESEFRALFATLTRVSRMRASAAVARYAPQAGP